MSEFHFDTERCWECDGHFRHFPGCSEYRESDPRNEISLSDRLAIHRLLDL
jgi:hypothetical protein